MRISDWSLDVCSSDLTLPLMNGHRLISGSTQQTNSDYPFLPELAIERVEIVADGASAIYGSDAVAGVVNFITRKRVSGFEANVRSEERRVGKECVSTCRSRWST